jgi:hypothetical protein
LSTVLDEVFPETVFPETYAVPSTSIRFPFVVSKNTLSYTFTTECEDGEY